MEQSWSMIPFENFTIEEKISLCKRIQNGEKNEKGYIIVEREKRKAYVEVSDEQYDEYCDFADGSRKYRYTEMDKIMDIIRKNSGCTIAFEEKILPLMKQCAIYLYTDLTDEQKELYEKKQVYGRDYSKFRGCCISWGNCLLLYPKGTHYKDELIEIFLHNQNETIESAAWILMHELGHAMVTRDFSGELGGYIHSLKWIHEGHLKDRGLDRDKYYDTDEGHEEDPEEQFCNLLANTWIQKKLNRFWWRENMAPKAKEE
jgi:hypothetical protein